MGEGGRQERVRVKKLDGEVEPPVLPLRVQVVIDLLVCNRHHHDEDPEEDDADEELVDDPHRHHRRRDGLLPEPPHLDAGVHVALGHRRLSQRHHTRDPPLDAGGVVHRLHLAPRDRVDVDLGLVGQQLGDAGGVVWQVRHFVVVWVPSERL